MALLLLAAWLNCGSTETCFPSFWQRKAKRHCLIHLQRHHNKVLESIYNKQSAGKNNPLKESGVDAFHASLNSTQGAHRNQYPIRPEKGPFAPSSMLLIVLKWQREREALSMSDGCDSVGLKNIWPPPLTLPFPITVSLKYNSQRDSGGSSWSEPCGHLWISFPAVPICHTELLAVLWEFSQAQSFVGITFLRFIPWLHLHLFQKAEVGLIWPGLLAAIGLCSSELVFPLEALPDLYKVSGTYHIPNRFPFVFSVHWLLQKEPPDTYTVTSCWSRERCILWHSQGAEAARSGHQRGAPSLWVESGGLSLHLQLSLRVSASSSVKRGMKG